MNADVDVVLDASAILALLQREPGWQQVDAVGRRVASAVNLAEVGSRLMLGGYSDDEMRGALVAVRARMVIFDATQAHETARLAPLTRSAGLSLGDRACLALARLRELPVLTADRRWATLDLGVAVTLIR